MKKFCLALLALTVCLAIPSAAQTITHPSQDEALLRHWIQTLGSDDFCGRMLMTEYETKTIDYLASEMRAIGLEPAFGGSYFQEYTVLRKAGRKILVMGYDNPNMEIIHERTGLFSNFSAGVVAFG